MDDDGNLVLYAHIFANSLEPTKLAKENPQFQADSCLKISQQPKEHVVNTPMPDDPYCWLEKDNPRRHMTDKEIIQQIIQQEIDRLERLGIICKALTKYSSPVLLVKRKQQNL